PTNTPVAPTNTPTPAGVIVGHVTWQGIPQPDARNNGITATLSLCVSGTPTSYNVATDAGGYFTVTTGLPVGSYNWNLKCQLNLGNACSLTLAASTASVEMGTQRAGDATGDNLVSAQDFSTLKNTFGKSVGQPGYDGRADFNRDTVV